MSRPVLKSDPQFQVMEAAIPLLLHVMDNFTKIVHLMTQLRNRGITKPCCIMSLNSLCADAICSTVTEIRTMLQLTAEQSLSFMLLMLIPSNPVTVAQAPKVY
jgi:hypothetical protein